MVTSIEESPCRGCGGYTNCHNECSSFIDFQKSIVEIENGRLFRPKSGNLFKVDASPWHGEVIHIQH